MHGWTDGGTERDIAAIRLLGRRVGDRMALMHDSACHLKTFGDAVVVGRACDEAGFFWYEDPYSDGGLSAHAHRRLREMIRTPILLGEHVRGVEAMANIVAADGTDFVRADPDLDIGITGTMKNRAHGRGFGLDVELHGNGPAHRHCMAAIRNTNSTNSPWSARRGAARSARSTRPNIPTNLTLSEDGCFGVPDGPGLGVEYDWDFIRKNLIDHVVVQ